MHYLEDLHYVVKQLIYIICIAAIRMCSHLSGATARSVLAPQLMRFAQAPLQAAAGHFALHVLRGFVVAHPEKNGLAQLPIAGPLGEL